MRLNQQPVTHDYVYMTEKNKTSEPIYVAFAEDHQTVRETIIMFLEMQGGIKVIIKAANGKDLLQKIERSEIKPDVCLMDIMMPKMNGFETVSRIRNKWPEMKILVLSGFLREEYIIKMIRSGANGYLSKDCHPKEIKKAIVEVKRNDIYNSENFTPKLIAAVRDNEIRIPKLTEKEMQLLKWCIEDMTYAEIAVEMHTSPKSVEGYRNKLFQKLGVKTKVGLAMYAVRYGYVTMEPGIKPQ